ncbi:bifunctional enoyl-CoA hydratase/phosphate acetyltransferase [Aureibacter tunicatorum]|uniref:Phosphate butyryltransferase n=1 Tax=Aureibacter tunicatorum TaxID=866807 RepID=A0AAE3XTG4_9BACT|nr:bifunctional enoyl-CoA hydratase/phosphate acetyltransferase [Aureibacter tunicatorum]MDR6241694.1 phosphate butyryltransferase [Aureibacter tunicatorum]BDD07320.1 phosphate butyryltransferase [Aureibacter tunicatorum]
MLKKLADLKQLYKSNGTIKRLVLCSAADEHSLSAVKLAVENQIIHPILVGDEIKIKNIANSIDFNTKNIEIVDLKEEHQIVEHSIKLIRDGKADILMKGKITTAKLLKGVLNKEWGLKKNKILSHFALFEIPAYHKLLALTDAAMNISPSLQDKIHIINNTVEFLRKLGVETPKVAAVAAVEMVNEKMQATLDAALLSIMCRRGQIEDCIIDGPLAFDNAISPESKVHKGILSEVAGDADILLAPEIESGNVLYKSFVFFANALVASVILGATVPIVLTSRSDSEATKLYSIILAASV